MTTDAFDAGADLFSGNPELLATEVWHIASRQYDTKDDQQEFVNGYIAAIKRRNAYLREKQDAQDPFSAAVVAPDNPDTDAA